MNRQYAEALDELEALRREQQASSITLGELYPQWIAGKAGLKPSALTALAAEYGKPADLVAHVTSYSHLDLNHEMPPAAVKSARQTLDIAAEHGWDIGAISAAGDRDASEYSPTRFLARNLRSWDGMAQAAAAEREGRATHVRWGQWGASSHNHRDGVAEAGVSAYAAWIMPDESVVLDLRGVDGLSEHFLDASDLWEVSGTLLDGTGADGEPLLADVTGTRIHPTTITRILH